MVGYCYAVVIQNLVTDLPLLGLCISSLILNKQYLICLTDTFPNITQLNFFGQEAEFPPVELEYGVYSERHVNPAHTVLTV